MLIKINKDHKIKIYKHGDDRRLVISWSLSGGKRSNIENLKGQIKQVGGVNWIHVWLSEIGSCLIDG